MKTIVMIFLSIFSTLCFSQNTDIYILVSSNSKLDTIKSKNDSLVIELYRLKSDYDGVKQEFYINSKGDLKRKLSLKVRKRKFWN